MSRLAMLKSRLEDYRAAEKKILNGEEYQLGSRRLRRPDLLSVQKMIRELEEKIDALELVGGRVRRVVFVD